MTLKGNTGDFPLETVLRLLTETKKTGELALRGDKGEGALGLAEGRVIAAVFANEGPIPALGSIWDMGRADFEFTAWNEAPPGNLEGELQDNLRKAEEYKKWIESVRQVIPTDRTRFRLSERAAEQGAVTFTSDRWRVVLAVNGQRDVNALAEHLKVDRDTALTTLAGLVRDGVIETIELPTEMQAPPAPSPPRREEITFAPPPREEATFAPPPREEATFAPPPSTPQAPPPSELAPQPPVPPSANAETTDWTAALLERRQQQGGASAYRSPTEWTPPAPVPESPTWSAPPPAPGTEEWTPPEPVMPDESAPVFDTSADTWTPPEARAETPQWTAPAETPETQWTPPAPTPEAPQWTAPAVESAEDWTPPPPPPPAPEPAPASGQWDTSTAEPLSPEPVTPEPAISEPATSQLDDRLAALEGLFKTPVTEAPPPPATEWRAPAPAPEWNAPAPAAAPEAPTDDPRLSALSAPPPPPVVEPAKPAAPQMPPSEWAPPPSEARAPEKKKGIFGGLFGGKREESAGVRGAARMEPGASSRAGMLAALSNALLTEYNSGHYGKTKVDERISSLLMRVDEQADPIDKPLPVVDDRLDVQAFERIGLPETQAAPYLAMLVSTIYADAEKAFGKDKARRGYKLALMQTFHGDMSALSGLSGKLPKI